MVLLVTLVTLATAPAYGQVFVRASDEGRGMLRARSGECFLITPYHVVEYVDRVTLVGLGRREAEAQLETTYQEDVALLRVSRSTPMDCGGPWDDGSGLGDRITSASRGILQSMEGSGELRRRPVDIVSAGDAVFIQIREVNPEDRLYQGLSGSVLLIGSRPAGMLMGMDPSTGAGIVMRLDHLSNLTRSFFDIRSADGEADAGTYLVEEERFTGLVLERASLMDRPDRLGSSLGTVAVGSTLQVTGRVVERLWFRVRTPDGRTGFVPTRAVRRM